MRKESTMRFINPDIHAIIDYLMSVLLILSPWIFEFKNDSYQTWIPMTFGFMMAAISLMSDHRYSFDKVISTRIHLNLDIVFGAILAYSPWMLGFSHRIFLPHLILGILLMAVSLSTKMRLDKMNVHKRTRIHRRTKTEAA